MAVRAAAATGNLTTAGTWGLVDSTSYSNSESANTALTTSQVSSSTFTPGAITIDGIGVKIASRAASPSGTMTVQLTQGGVLVTGTNVTVNVSDIPTATATSGSTTPVGTAEGGWFFCKFAAPVTLVGATAYAVSAATSSGSQVNLWSAATTNWSRFLRTTTTGAPAASDDMIITGEWTAAATMTARTVTMDSTAATVYGSNTTSQVTPAVSICKGGTLAYGTSAATAYNFVVAGYIVVYNGGTFNQGVKGGTTVPIGSSATLKYNCTANGDFGTVIRNGGTRNIGGNPRTAGKAVNYCHLNADAAIAATTLNVDTDTGWLSGDSICIAPTTTTATQLETRILNANAGASSMVVTAGLTNAHSGTSPTQAEVGLLTRNCVVQGVSASIASFEYYGTTASVVSLDWVEFAFMGVNTSAQKSAMSVDMTLAFSATNFSIHEAPGTGISLNSSSQDSFTIQGFVIYALMSANSNSAIKISSNLITTNWIIDSGLICGGTAINIVGLNASGITGTISNIFIAGISSSSGSPFAVSGGGPGLAGTIGTMSNITIHSNSVGTTGGFILSGTVQGTISNLNVWRCGSNGIKFIGGSSSSGGQGGSFARNPGLTFSTFALFGNSLDNISVPQGTGTVTFANGSLNGDTSQSTTNNVGVNALGCALILIFRTCSFSVASGIKTAATNDFSSADSVLISNGIQIICDNCLFGSAALYQSSKASSVNIGDFPFLAFQNFNQTTNDNRAYWGSGTSTLGLVQTDTGTVYGGNPRSEKMTPQTTAWKLVSSSIYVPCASGKAATPIVQVQKNGTYNGAAPRLILKRQDSMGVTSDTVLQSLSAAANTWQGLTGTTGVAPQDGVYEFVIDCDGTAGSIFVGDMTATTA